MGRCNIVAFADINRHIVEFRRRQQDVFLLPRSSGVSRNVPARDVNLPTPRSRRLKVWTVKEQIQIVWAFPVAFEQKRRDVFAVQWLMGRRRRAFSTGEFQRSRKEVNRGTRFIGDSARTNSPRSTHDARLAHAAVNRPPLAATKRTRAALIPRAIVAREKDNRLAIKTQPL